MKNPNRVACWQVRAPWSLCILGFTSLLLSGCLSSTQLAKENPSSGLFPNHSLSQILNSIPSFPDELNRARLEAQIAVASPEMDGTFTAIAESSRFDSLFVRIRFPLGIEGARVLITPDSAFTFDRLQNVVFRTTSERMKAILPGSVIDLNLIEQVTGFIDIDPTIEWRIQTESNRYYLHAPDESIRYTIHPQLWRIEHIQQRDPSGTVTEQRWYLDFKERDGLLVPTRMIYVQPEEDTRLSISLKSVDKNPGTLHFDLGVRADTKWKDLLP